MIARDQLICKALLALDEICDTCGEAPVARSFLLRFVLAWLFHESGGDPAKKWIFTSFWEHATRPRAALPHDRLIDDYCRGNGARSALNGICREIGLFADVELDRKMRAARRGVKSGMGGGPKTGP